MGGELTSHPITSDRKYSDEQSNLCLRILSSLQDLFCRHTYRKKKMDICDNALFTYENALPATCWKASVYLHRNRLRFDIFHSRVPQRILRAK